MDAGMVIEVRGTEQERQQTVIEQGQDLRSRYERLVALTIRMGHWLESPQGLRLSPEEWERQFTRYQEQLEQLRRLGDERRPFSLRPRGEMLSGDALVGEVLELFAA
jgi:hypothetical protein